MARDNPSEVVDRTTATGPLCDDKLPSHLWVMVESAEHLDMGDYRAWLVSFNRISHSSSGAALIGLENLFSRSSYC